MSITQIRPRHHSLPAFASDPAPITEAELRAALAASGSRADPDAVVELARRDGTPVVVQGREWKLVDEPAPPADWFG